LSAHVQGGPEILAGAKYDWKFAVGDTAGSWEKTWSSFKSQYIVVNTLRKAGNPRIPPNVPQTYEVVKIAEKMKSGPEIHLVNLSVSNCLVASGSPWFTK